MNRTLKMKGNTQIQQLRTRPLFAQEAKADMRNHNKNINKLIFYESDEEHSSQDDNAHDKLYMTTREMTNSRANSRGEKQAKQSFKAETLMLRPSIMKFSLEADGDYYDFMPNAHRKNIPKQNNYVASTATTASKKDGVSAAGRQPQKKPKQQEIQSIVFEEQIELPSPPKITDQKKQSRLSQIVPSTLYFEDSEDDAKQQEKAEEREEKEGSNRVDAESLTNEVVSTQIQQLATQQQSEQGRIEPFNILQIDSATVARSAYFSDIIKDTKRYEAISSLMLQPLRAGTRHIFQVQVCNSILEKTFQCWLDCHPKMKLLMKAKKITKLHRTEYQLTTYFEGCQQFCQACTIVSNIERSEFNIEKSVEARKELLGTIACSVTLQSNKNLVLYHPAVDPQTNLPKRIYEDSQYTTLKQIYQLKQSHSISYLLTTKLKVEEKLELMRDFKFKVSDKSMEFRNKEGELKLVIGKKASKTYTLVAGPGLTPLQIFSLAIINVETY